MKADLYHHQGQMPNNFQWALPKRQQALRAIEMFKDEYLLDFINVEELGVRDEQDVDERVVEQEIVQNIKNFIMTFGKSFTYIGHQVHYEKIGHDHWVDLLFFNRELRAVVCVELKRGAFKTAYLGQLAAYLRVLDDDERLPGENPSMEGNGRSTRIWLDMMFKRSLKRCVDWSCIDKTEYMDAMKQSPTNASHVSLSFKTLINKGVLG